MIRNIKTLIKNFLIYMNILDDENFIGVLFYGSMQNGTYNVDSDIDLIIVYKNLDVQYKGYYKYKGYNFECFKRSLKSLYERVNTSYKKRLDDVIPIIAYSEVLFCKDNSELIQLQKYTINKFKHDFPKLEQNEALYLLMEAYKVTQNIIKLYRNNDKYYNVYYGIVITKLQNICHILEGKSKISTVKIYKLYLQDELCRKQKRKLPNKVFIELLLKSIESRDKKQQIEAIKCMYIYIQNIYSKIYLGLDDFKNDINESLIKNKDIALIGREY